MMDFERRYQGQFNESMIRVHGDEMQGVNISIVYRIVERNVNTGEESNSRPEISYMLEKGTS